METTDKKETKERTGSYRLVKICINEIEAMKQLSLGRETILKNLKEYFGTTMTVRQLSSNIYRVEEELKDELAGQLRKDQIAELVKNRELIYKNLSVLKKLVDPSYTPILPVLSDRRVAYPTAEPAVASAPVAASRVATASKVAPAVAAKIEVEVSDEARQIWEDLKQFLDKTRYPYNPDMIPKILATINANPAMFKSMRTPIERRDRLNNILKFGLE